MKKRSFALSLLALILIAVAVVRPAMAYFTSNSRADGQVQLTLGSKTDIHESYVGLKKTVQIKNTKGDPVWVRARAFAGSQFTLEETAESGWSKASDGWWYYLAAPIPVGESTPALYVEVTDIPTSTEYDMESFNVAVVYESTMAFYDEDGEPLEADWSAEYIIDSATTNP